MTTAVKSPRAISSASRGILLGAALAGVWRHRYLLADVDWSVAGLRAALEARGVSVDLLVNSAGLGHTACNPTLDTLKRFRPVYERRLKSLDFVPAFDLDGALATARRMTGRDDAGAHLSMESES